MNGEFKFNKYLRKTAIPLSWRLQKKKHASSCKKVI